MWLWYFGFILFDYPFSWPLKVNFTLVPRFCKLLCFKCKSAISSSLRIIHVFLKILIQLLFKMGLPNISSKQVTELQPDSRIKQMRLKSWIGAYDLVPWEIYLVSVRLYTLLYKIWKIFKWDLVGILSCHVNKFYFMLLTFGNHALIHYEHFL